jgi:hypothetical protein
MPEMSESSKGMKVEDIFQLFAQLGGHYFMVDLRPIFL